MLFFWGVIVQVGNVLGGMVEVCGQVWYQQFGEFGELGKIQYLVVFGQDFFQDFFELDYFFGLLIDWGVIVQQLGGVVVYLFEFGYCGQYVVVLFDFFGVFDFFYYVGDDGLIQ